MSDRGQQRDPDEQPEGTYDPEMTEGDEGNTPPEEGDGEDEEGPVARPL